LKIKAKIVSCHTAESKPVKQEVNRTVILPHLVFPGLAHLQVGKRIGVVTAKEFYGAFVPDVVAKVVVGVDGLSSIV